ncbi:P-loop containing nucleoside triphosphate hydrolase protein [Mucor mucedo]|uniref:P-loop containing nucleoside triphosphate hydrolase protein n=1 Tax=Mucor mucedo TaxID=29922 RepID=UPI0022211028|nr:P-loop containing nucleoside triphosphate hydrolase protein [Mucor mucedo]KAI7896067.1 P-loop containing nucleoside triphosphate hydrolase protein [Mucor mucedo]
MDKGKGKEKVFNLTAELDNLPWVEKYRPKTLDDLVSHDNITSTIEKFIEAKKLPHLLFYGPPGTGKTSTILACARQLYGDKFKAMILELNASDDRGIDVVREQIKNFASTRNIYSSGFKLIVLDEADSMTNQAQAALRRVIEKYTKNVRFCIICNYVSKILPAIQSRCTRFRFSPLEVDQIDERLGVIVEAEGVNLTEDGKKALLRLSKGDMRRALNILQACHASYDRIDETAIYSCTGHPDPKVIERIARWMMNEDFTTAYSKIEEIKRESGIALQDIISDLHTFVSTIEYPAKSRILLLKNLCTLEYRLGEGANEHIQLGALVGTFKSAQENLAK